MGNDKNKQPEKRSYFNPDFRSLSEEGKEGTITGHAAVFDKETIIGGWYKEIIERSAFNGCDFTDVLFSVNHDLGKIPCARSRRNNSNSTLRLATDELGLAFEADLDVENNVESKSLHSAIKRGDINGMSFIFWVDDEAWENLESDLPTRRIQKISKVIEISAVNFPAYEQTTVEARSKVLDSAKDALENARSALLDNKDSLEILKMKNQILGKNY